MKKALLVVSFGTSYPDTCEKNIVACERELAASCPDRDTFRAFTSGMIIRKLKQRDGIEIDTPLQALQKLAEQGYQDVAIQSLHIINGDEYEKIVREAAFAALKRAVDGQLLQLKKELFFNTRSYFESFERFDQRMIQVTHQGRTRKPARHLPCRAPHVDINHISPRYLSCKSCCITHDFGLTSKNLSYLHQAIPQKETDPENHQKDLLHSLCTLSFFRLFSDQPEQFDQPVQREHCPPKEKNEKGDIDNPVSVMIPP